MVPVEGLFEAHLAVREIERSVAFYRDVVGLELGLLQSERPAAFFWVGGRGRSMMGMFTSGSWPIKTMQHHVSFEVRLEDILAAPQRLRSADITPLGRPRLGGRGEPIDEPIVFAWMPAASVFFDDPDGNILEYVCMLPEPPSPGVGVVSWSEWKGANENRPCASGSSGVTPIQRLFEGHIGIRNLERSVAFYRDVVGLKVGLLQSQSTIGMGGALFWVGGRGRSMMGVFSLGASWPLIIMQHHVAFQVKLGDVLAAPGKLRLAGITPMGGQREPIDEPVVFGWMPAASVFFDDPDGNLLEYISMLPDPPQPDLRLLSWSEWQSGLKKSKVKSHE
jgi:catechol 2,3-dioxygenase-like lactoylglutathione lyase family enzyme